MKYTLHIPVEQYGFVAAELETEEMGDIAPLYSQIARSFKAGQGLPKKDYDEFIDRVMMGGTNHVSTLEKMSQEQRDGYQLIKRSQARVKRLLDKQSEALDYPD